MSLSFQQKIALSDKEFLTLVSGTGGNGVEFYAYIMAELEAFKRMERDFELKKQSINFFDYGKIVESGFGLIPPAEVKEKMEAEYGFKHAS